MVSQGFGLHRTQIVYSEYALLGPTPAITKIARQKDIIDVLRLLANEEVAFLEPSPKGGTYRKIRELWTAAGINPNWIDYENTGTSALGAMRQAIPLGAYTMAEVGTFIKHRSELGEHLALLYRDDLSLRNVYSAVVINANKVANSKQVLASKFLEYLVSSETQNFIEKYNKNNFGALILSPAAHLDSELLKRQSEIKLLKKQENVQLLSILSIGLFLLFVTTLFFGYRFNRANIRQLEMEKSAVISKQDRDNAINSNKIKSDFLANMSHEMRTPLTAIIGYAEIIRDDDLTDAQRETDINTIVSSGNHLLNLINDLLDLSKIEAEKLDTENVSVELMPLLDNLNKYVNVQSREKALKFEINYKYPLPQSILSDSIRLKQILINLCCNAVKFTEKGYVRLNVSCDITNQVMLFEVIDTGIGIEQNELDKIFLAFTQADTSTTRIYGGTGLGLSLSKKLAKILGGDITVESKIGEGSRFCLSINLGSLENVELIQSNETVLAPAKLEVPDSVKSNKSKNYSGNILLVEDVIENQELVTFYLKKLGLDVTSVENGELAINAVDDDKFDLVLMDLQMPVMGGIEATSILRQKGFTKPIIALTANVMKEDREKCYNAGCDDFLEKPINRKRFIEIIEKHLVYNLNT